MPRIFKKKGRRLGGLWLFKGRLRHFGRNIKNWKRGGDGLICVFLANIVYCSSRTAISQPLLPATARTGMDTQWSSESPTSHILGQSYPKNKGINKTWVGWGCYSDKYTARMVYQINIEASLRCYKVYARGHADSSRNPESHPRWRLVKKTSVAHQRGLDTVVSGKIIVKLIFQSNI